jgi:hypothetical protein
MFRDSNHAFILGTPVPRVVNSFTIYYFIRRDSCKLQSLSDGVLQLVNDQDLAD